MLEQLWSLRLASISRPKIGSEILVAVFSTASAAGLTTDAAISTMASVAESIDGKLAAGILELKLRLAVSVDRPKTYAAILDTSTAPLIADLSRVLAAAEASGEDVSARARQLFDEFSVKREDLVTRRAETYPLVMIVLMVLF